MYRMDFVMVHDGKVVHAWECTEKFDSKDTAMRFAQNTAKAFNGSGVQLFYRIVH